MPLPDITRVLTAQQLTCDRAGIPLFDAVNLELRIGEILQIAGPNGSGKTTLLRMLAGLSSDYTGSVEWWNGVRESNNTFLYLGHRHGIKAALTPLENLRWYHALEVDTDFNEKRARVALAEWGLAGYEHCLCGRLSAGQQQRVALARLSLTSAAVWLLDEPFTSIDAKGVSHLENKITTFAKQGGAVILVTHHVFALHPALRTFSLCSMREG